MLLLVATKLDWASAAEKGIRTSVTTTPFYSIWLVPRFSAQRHNDLCQLTCRILSKFEKAEANYVVRREGEVEDELKTRSKTVASLFISLLIILSDREVVITSSFGIFLLNSCVQAIQLKDSPPTRIALPHF